MLLNANSCPNLQNLSLNLSVPNTPQNQAYLSHMHLQSLLSAALVLLILSAVFVQIQVSVFKEMLVGLYRDSSAGIIVSRWVNLSKVLLQQGSADKKQGLFNEVFIWQLFLITEEANGGVRDTLLSEIPIGTKKGEKLPKKYHKKKSWKYFGAKETKGKLFDSNTEKLTKAYFKKKSEGKIKDKDFVTNQDFAIAAEFFKNWNTKKFEKELSDIEEELSLPTPLTVLGNVTYPPPGFYTGKRSKCDWKYVAVVKAKTQYEIAKKKKNKGRIASLKKKLGKKQLAYQA